MEIRLRLFVTWCQKVASALVLFLRLRVVWMMRWFGVVGSVRLIRSVMTRQMRLLTLEGVGLMRLLLTAGGLLISLPGTGSHYPHGLFIAIARAVVNDDGLGGTVPNPLVGVLESKRRRIFQAVREFAWLPGPETLWSGGWQGWPALSVTADDVRAWPFSVGSLVELVAYLSSLHGPSQIHDLAFGGIW